jgi:hypothetical protein
VRQRAQQQLGAGKRMPQRDFQFSYNGFQIRLDSVL